MRQFDSMSLPTVFRSVIIAWALSAGVLANIAHAQVAASNAFTYQGELRSAGAVVNGTKDIRFRLYDAPTAGNPVGGELLAANLQVVDGLFTVELNFGSAPFQGQARWLEIRVAEPGSPIYTTLSPRQSITVAPYALYALNAPPAPAAPGKITASVDAHFSVNDRSGWTHVEALGDDTCFPNIPLGFTFTGWGRTDTQVSISSNGVLFFGGGCSTTFTNTALPSGFSTSPFLAFFWDDLFDYGASEYFEYATYGTAPGRVFNLYFRSRMLTSNCSATDPVNLMITIHEGSNLVRVTYMFAGSTGCAELRGGSATFGLQGPGGGVAQSYMVSFNAPILDNDAPRQSISYQPPSE